jgi:hypothetical protein
VLSGGEQRSGPAREPAVMLPTSRRYLPSHAPGTAGSKIGRMLYDSANYKPTIANVTGMPMFLH